MAKVLHALDSVKITLTVGLLRVMAKQNVHFVIMQLCIHPLDSECQGTFVSRTGISANEKESCQWSSVSACSLKKGKNT